MKRAPPPDAKVAPPILKGVVPRTRIFGLLDRMREQPAIWVCGPAGCGKTTLVGSYLEARRLPLLWYQVDAGDKDPARFFYYMGLASKRASPVIGSLCPCSRRNTCQASPPSRTDTSRPCAAGSRHPRCWSSTISRT
jgi:ATP/maltotriose-dependent transcriptional regulator MalT